MRLDIKWLVWFHVSVVGVVSGCSLSVAALNGSASVRDSHRFTDFALWAVPMGVCAVAAVAWGDPDAFAPIGGDAKSWGNLRERDETIANGKTWTMVGCTAAATFFGSAVFGTASANANKERAKAQIAMEAERERNAAILREQALEAAEIKREQEAKRLAREAEVRQHERALALAAEEAKRTYDLRQREAALQRQEAARVQEQRRVAALRSQIAATLELTEVFVGLPRNTDRTSTFNRHQIASWAFVDSFLPCLKGAGYVPATVEGEAAWRTCTCLSNARLFKQSRAVAKSLVDETCHSTGVAASEFANSEFRDAGMITWDIAQCMATQRVRGIAGAAIYCACFEDLVRTKKTTETSQLGAGNILKCERIAAPAPIAPPRPVPRRPAARTRPTDDDDSGDNNESGHQAGYKWAEKIDADDPSQCENQSQSFTEGCEEWLEENR